MFLLKANIREVSCVSSRAKTVNSCKAALKSAVGPNFIASAYNIVLRMKLQPQAEMFLNPKVLVQASGSERQIKSGLQALGIWM